MDIESQNSGPESKNLELELKKFADLALSEDWPKIDVELPGYCEKPVFTDWAKENLRNPESQLRDLATTILEASSCSLDDKDIDNLVELIREDYQKNPYPSFRAACALTKRKSDERVQKVIDEIKNKLRGFTKDPDVSKIARRYLDLLSA